LSAATGRWARESRRGINMGLPILIALLVVVELAHRSLPQIPEGHATHLVVIGDSISAGIDAGKPWPKLLEKQSGIQVKNLARPAIGTREATEIAKKVTPDDSLIFLEIGGNDMLFDLPAYDFEQQLEQLLKQLDNGRRTLVMFELPLLPHKIAYGRIQRRLAAEHHVFLIPKRFFIDIISGGDATSDGLHLSHSGAQRMAELVEGLLRPALAASGTTK
jgi:lysophospholipase L1-like esterase